MIYRFMLYEVFNGKHVNLFRDGRTFKNESYAKRIQREQSEYFTDKILIKR